MSGVWAAVFSLFPIWGFALVFGAHHVIAKRLEAARLRHPVLEGIPLPQTDDPRWEWDDHRQRASFGPFEVQWIEVIFEGKTLGHWRAYTDAVRAPIKKRIEQAAAHRALAAIAELDDPPR